MGPLGAAIGWLILALLWLLDRFFDHVEIVSRPKQIRIAGALLIAIWIWWHLWSLKTIRSWWNEDRLCTSGPYRFVRHPIYAGAALLFGFGLALILNSWILLLFPVLSCLIWSALVRKEEMMMENVFGDEYKRYATCTGRFLPKFFRR